ncbi:MAG: hypothetical protein WDN06_05350 [Asticcacaulis sp.]
MDQIREADHRKGRISRHAGPRVAQPAGADRQLPATAENAQARRSAHGQPVRQPSTARPVTWDG